jgi:formylglycine-generating enzyme required for sulfatase activity/tRNA A-37 threonylcarbamoyl transferase component Bud32
MNPLSPALEAVAILADVIRRQEAGEAVSSESVLLEHPRLAGLLGPRLKKLTAVTRAFSSAETTTPAAGFSPPDVGRRYQLLREIDHGGQAVVYLARDVETERNVAVKVLRSGTLADARERARFEREADILSALDHPGIVSVLERGQTADGALYLVMNYIAGRPLSAEALAVHPIEERLGLFVQVCRAVEAAHVRGVVHRDLKPSNVRVDDAGRAHVLDFGLAVSSQSLRATMSVTGQFLGTFLWASPEQARGESNVTPASDVWSLGVILHQLLTGGRFPPQVFAIVRSAISGEAPAKSARPDGDVPAGLRPLLERCLTIESGKRYQSAGELAGAVEAFLTSPAVRRRRRRPWVAVLVAVLLAAGSVAVLQWRRHAVLQPGAVPKYVGGHRTLELPYSYYLVWVPPGNAVLGSNPDVAARMPDEKQHRVVFDRGYFMAPAEVDRWYFGKLMGWTSPPPAGVPADQQQSVPVTHVSWADALEFCRRCSALSRHHIRLPTEDEWEYAARAGETGAYPSYMTVRGNTGGDWPMLPRYANFADASSNLPGADRRYDDGYPALSPKFAHLGNAWELTDMLGNVWEWTAEPYRLDLTAAAATRPAAGPVFVSTRGGSWRDHPLALRYSNRNPLPADFKGDNVGFRIVCDDPMAAGARR